MFIFICVAPSLNAREVININNNWRFFYSHEGSSDFAREVNLPHTWNGDALGGNKEYFRGTGNYLRSINIPAQWRGKRVFIRFNGAGTVADLLVNGKHVGSHAGGYNAFTFEITKFLNYGDNNKLWVVVNNSPRLDVLPVGGDFNIYGGLHRDVEIIVTEPSVVSLTDYSGQGAYIHQRNVSAQRAELEAIVKVDGLSDRVLEIGMIILSAEMDTVFSGSERLRLQATGKGQVSIKTAIDRPHLWNGRSDPYMYKAVFKVTDNQNLSDSVSVPLGLRTFGVDPGKGFTLNGRPYPLNGVVYYEDRAMVGNALRNFQVTDDLDIMEEMGVNAIRAAGYPHNRKFYEECDKRGMIVWSDLPFLGQAYLTDHGYLASESFLANGRQQLMEMMKQNFNNPSILMWGVFSNLNARGDDPVPFVYELNSIAKREDPGRFTVASSNEDGKLNFITELISFDQTLGWKEGMPSDISIWLGQITRNWSGNLKPGLSYGAGGVVTHQSDTLARPQWLSGWHPERWQTYFHEQYFSAITETGGLWGAFIANMFDYGSSVYSWGEGIGIDDRGMVTFDRSIRKDAFWFYKANWNSEDKFVRLAEARWDRRRDNRQTIKAYSNSEQVELWLNGVSMGIKPGINGTFMWPEIELRTGANILEARSESGSHSITITIDPTVNRL